MRIIRPGLILLAASALLASCMQKDQPVPLPEKGSAEHAKVQMGPEYLTQVFYSFENGVVKTSEYKMWDLAFEASPRGYHIYMNGGNGLFIHNTGQTDIRSVTKAPNMPDHEWGSDHQSGDPQKTAIGEWRTGGISKNEVYIVRSGVYPDYIYKKLTIQLADDEKYIISYADLESTTQIKNATIPKNDAYSFVYFSLEDEEVVSPDPPKHTWDIVFTRYRYLFPKYGDITDYPYGVTGVLLNAYSTQAAEDSLKGYSSIDINSILNMKFVPDRDVIGYDWKDFNFSTPTTSRFIVFPNKTYVVKTQTNQFWKLHFLDFYDSQTGEKGTPSFEFERLQ